MANPQTEDGHLRIANELWEAVIRLDLSGNEFKVLLAILRKLYGYRKKEDWITNRQLAVMTGLRVERCSEAVSKLAKKSVISITENRKGYRRKIRFNKDFDNWQSITENRKGITQKRKGYYGNAGEVLRKTVSRTTIDNTTTDTLNKNNIYGGFFDFWNSLEIRPAHRKVTEEGKAGINARLEDGYTVEEIKTAIENYAKSTLEWVVKNRENAGWTLGQFLSRYEGKNLERFKEPLMAEDGGSVDGLDSRRNGTGETMKNGSIVDGIKYVDDGEGGLCPE